MDKSHFKPDTRYVLALHDAKGTVRPANLYVYRCYDKFMVARSTSGDGLLQKIGYDAVERIVDESAVPAAERFLIPAGMLEEANWRDRNEMQVYSSAPGRGK
ncbi:MAG: hypothetical protein WCA09_04500 [Burkholderiales bacterium]